MKLLRSKILWFVVILLIIAGAIGYFIFFKPPKKTEYVTADVLRGDVIQTVSATGKIKSRTEISLSFKNGGKLAEVKTKVSDQVKAGQILAQLKANDLQINIQRAQADLDEARANLAKLTAGATKQDVAVFQAAVDKAVSDLAAANDNLQIAKETYQQNIDNIKQSMIADIASVLAKADISLQRLDDILYFKDNENNLLSTNANLRSQVYNYYNLSVDKVDQAQINYDAAKLDATDAKIDAAIAATESAVSQLATTMDNLSELFSYIILTSSLTQTDIDAMKVTVSTEKNTTYTSLTTIQTDRNSLATARLNYQTKVQESENAITAAERNLTRAKADLAFKQAPARPEDITLYQVSVRKAEASLRLAQDNYSDTIISAPIDGLITAVKYEVGEQVSPGQPVILMLANENYEVEVDIPESDIAKIGVGDEVTITLDAFTSNDIFHGTIIKIDPAQTEIQDVIYYKVIVGVMQDQPEAVLPLVDKIKPGMTANVTIGTAEVKDVLYIPLRAVKDENGKKMVDILENGMPKTVTIEIGLKGDDGLVEVKSGLAAGQQVVTFVREAK